MKTLSIIVPSIRPEGVIKLYDSIIDSYSGKWEMVVVGPNKIKCLSNRRNFWCGYSLRSPNAAQQIGLCLSQCDYISFASDDGIFLPGELDKAMGIIETMGTYKSIVVGKYLEGDNPHPDMAKYDYYKFGYHKSYQLKGVPQDGLIFNCGVISRKFMLELGGWDAQNFECTTCAHADLGIRASKAGAEMVLMDSPMFKCSHQPGKTGDHKPVHNAMKRDLKNFAKIYGKPNDRINISLDNWERTEPVWKERFNGKTN